MNLPTNPFWIVADNKGLRLNTLSELKRQAVDCYTYAHQNDPWAKLKRENKATCIQVNLKGASHE